MLQKETFSIRNGIIILVIPQDTNWKFVLQKETFSIRNGIRLSIFRYLFGNEIATNYDKKPLSFTVQNFGELYGL